VEVIKNVVTAFGVDSMMFIGGIVFIIGTIVFLLEMFGLSIYLSPPVIRKNRVKWDSMAIIQVAISAALFGGGLAATAGIVFLPGVAYLRPAQVLSVVLGILFGLPGALGIALGNTIADLLGGYLTLGSIAGFIGNFLTAYVPYRIINSPERAGLKSFGGVVVYVLGVVSGTFVIAFYIPYWLALLKIVPKEAAWTVVFGNIWLNGLVTSLTLGPILLKVLFPYVKKWHMYWVDRLAPETDG
jgi:energy-coupling factor transport system substrate-specific component